MKTVIAISGLIGAISGGVALWNREPTEVTVATIQKLDIECSEVGATESVDFCESVLDHRGKFDRVWATVERGAEPDCETDEIKPFWLGRLDFYSYRWCDCPCCEAQRAREFEAYVAAQRRRLDARVSTISTQSEE